MLAPLFETAKASGSVGHPTEVSGTITTWAVERAVAWRTAGNDLVVSCVAGRIGGATVTVTPWARNVVRCRFAAGTLPPRPGLSYVNAEAEPAIRLEMHESPDRLRVRLEALDVEIARDPWNVEFRTRDGRLLTREVSDDLNLKGEVLGPPPGFDVEGADRMPARRAVRSVETLLLDPADHWYGLGEKFTPLDKRGRTIAIWQDNAAGARTEAAYKNIPLVMTPRGYGIFVNSTSRVTCHLGSRSNRTWSFEVPGGVLDYFFIAGTLEEIVTSYARLTGFPPVPPKWSFGLWTSTCFDRADEANVRERARRLRAEGIPADVIHLDSYWQPDLQWCDLSWDRAAFPQPERTIADLHRQGYKVCLWENTYVSIHSPRFQEGAAHGYFLTQPDGAVYTPQLWSGAGGSPRSLCAIVDLTNPAAAEWFRGLHEPLLAMGVDTFKTDFGEEIPADAVFHNGRTGEEMRNLYARLYQELIFDLLRERHGRAVIWARAACPGAQRFPAHWSGDPHCTYEDMASTLRGGLSAGMSGLAFWSHDLGGFKGMPTPDLYVRWAQFSLLSGLARYHGTTPRDPWLFGEEALAIFRRYAELRYRLLPYLYSYAWNATETGLPLMRPLVLRYQDDPATFGIDLQYLLGDELLVAPVFTPENRVTVYLPRGRWTDFWTDQAHQGPTVLHRTVPLDTMPIFVRENSLLPLAPVVQHVDERPADPLTVEAYATSDAVFTVRGDEGATGLRVRRAGTELEFEASAAPVTYVVRFHGCAAAEAATADGSPVPRAASEDDLAARIQGWTDGLGTVVVKARAGRIRVTGCRFSS